MEEQAQSLFSNSTGTIQHSKPLKRNAIATKADKQIDSIDESEEFDSDQYIENASDWHDELDIMKMPHWLGPSATVFSSNPVDHQHYSLTAPPFSCQQILVRFDTSGPSFSLVPCSYQPVVYNDVFSNPENFNYNYNRI